MASLQDSTPFQNVVFKASHNSYDRKESLSEQLTLKSPIYQCGCRGIELDIWRHSSDSMNDGYFTVNHATNGGPKLSVYLDQLSDWHTQNPDHDVIWVMLDIKSDGGDEGLFPDEIDSYLTTYFGRGLIKTPHDLFPGLTDSNKLSDVVQAQGWPILGSLKNHFIFCLSGNEDWKKVYYRNNRSQRICFADCDNADQLTVPNSRVVYNVKAGSGKQADFNDLMQKKILTRVYDVDSEGDWDKAMGMGANILATDKVSDSSWAEVSPRDLYAAQTHL